MINSASKIIIGLTCVGEAPNWHTIMPVGISYFHNVSQCLNDHH